MSTVRPWHGQRYTLWLNNRDANTLSRHAKGARSRCEKLEAKIGRTGRLGPDDELAVELAWQSEGWPAISERSLNG